jgi:RHS repeat-associated protein
MRLGVRWLVAFLCCAVGLLGMVTPGADAAGSLGEGTGTSLGIAVRRLAMCLLFCVGLACWSASASQAAAVASPGGSGSPENPLVVPGVQVLDEGQQLQQTEETQRSSPVALSEREASKTKYEGLDPEQAANVASELFPTVIDDLAGGPPSLPAGQRITGFPAANVASVDLGEGKRGVVDSLEPVAVENGSGQRVPIDLSLTEAGGALHPTTPLVDVRIPKRLAEGVQLGETGVSLTPVDATGTPLGGSQGAVDGASVFYASDTQTDASMLVKPDTLGFAVDTLLFSVESPQQLSFRVGLPAGAQLLEDPTAGTAQIANSGGVIATIAPPSAEDASGAQVPVSMSISGDLLTVMVDDRAGNYQYPIEVDPKVEDGNNVVEDSHWRKESSGGTLEPKEWYEEGHGYELWDELFEGSHAANEWGALFYTAQGEAHIYELIAETYSAMPKFVENRIGIRGKGGWEPAAHILPSTYGRTTEPPYCAASGCPLTGGTAENVAEFKQSTVEAGSGNGHANLSAATVFLAQEHGPTATMDTTDSKLGDSGGANVFNTNGWIGPHSSSGMQVSATDPGVGVYGWKFSSPGSPEWKGEATGCGTGAICAPKVTTDFSYYGRAAQEENESGSWGYFTGEHGKLAEGNQTVELTAYDSMGLASTTIVGHVKVDASLPYNVTLSGLPSIVSEQSYPLTVSATDGSGSLESSGLASIKVAVDGHELGNAGGACTPGPCTGIGSWTLNGSEFAIGEHKLTVTATSNDGNVGTDEQTFKVAAHAAPIAMGPGGVDPLSGELRLSTTDVSVAAPGADLTVTRTYGSRHLTAGSAGPLGPQWSLSVGGAESITKLENGSVTLNAASGGQTTFAKREGGFRSPKGDPDLEVSEVKNAKGEPTEYVLKNAANDVTVRFTSTSGPTASLWKATKQEGPLASQTVRYTYQTVEGVTEPVQELAPEPAGVSCATELKAGCRALKFEYAKTTTATGNNKSQWGNYKGRLQEVVFTAYNTSTKAMGTKVVAEYAYDSSGRLRAEWDPQISPALKTTYGYDASGHVTAVSAPGQEPWLLRYGTIAGDANNGRLLSAGRPSAATALGSGEALVNSARPTLSTTHPVIGTALSVSNGTWSNEPLSYGDQWERCSSTGSECAPIAGATSPSYTPVVADNGHTLLAQVIATNADGSVAAASETSSEVPVAAPVYTTAFGSSGSGAGQMQEPTAVALAPSGNVWEVDAVNHRLDEFSAGNTFIEAIGWGVSNGKEEFQTCTSSCKAGLPGLGAGEFSNPEGIAINQSSGVIYVADSAQGRIQEFTASGAYVATIGSQGHEPGELYEAHEITLDSSGDLWVADSGNDRVEEFSASGTFLRAIGEAGKKAGQLEYPIGVAVDQGNVYVTDMENQRVDEFTLEGKAVREIGGSGTEGGKFTDPWGIVTDPINGDLYVTSYGDSRVEAFTPEGEYIDEIGHFGSEKEEFEYPAGLAINPTTSAFYIADEGDNRVDIWTPSGPTQEPIQPAPSAEGNAVNTIDYQVPLSGSGAPQQMGAAEVATWGQSQSETPTQATAIFPADEPVGWPAKEYKHATIYYFDSSNRAVNVATPTGGVSTTEYNETNDAVRALSPDNRAAALKEGCKSEKECKSSEVAKQLDTESTYNSTGSEPGTELESTLGPQHTVKLEGGAQVEARERTAYTYDAGAPTEGGPYHLPTTITSGAQYSGKEENVRKTTMSYSGQSNLGWKLRKPTSETTEPTGLNLVHTTMYETETGDVAETRMPANSKEKSPHATETVYYTAGTNPKVVACGSHPEWANLPCQTQPAVQPETSGLPKLAVTKVTYNIWDEPETSTETVESKTRTTTNTYDNAGRLSTTATTSTVGAVLPTVTNQYSWPTGALETVSTTTEGKTQYLITLYNKLGQLESYKDADENTSTYEYEIDGRIHKTNDGKGTQTFTYSEATDLLSEVVDSSHEGMKFTATYDVEGNMLTESYPNGMTAYYTYNQAGMPVGLEYKKTTHCTEKCTWFSDTVVPSIHGQWLEQTSTLSHQAYTYDAAGRLTQVQNTPAGKGCTTRIYAYDEDTNRTSLTTREPNTKGECTTTGGTAEKHSYDTADRLIDTGVSYNTFGDITSLPATDAGGKEASENLTSSYYVDNQLQSQTQNGETIGYNLDPAGRTLETVATGKTTSDILNHYAGPGDAPAWTINTGGEWTRNIPGIGGGLAAIENNGAAPVLELTNLQGDLVATASLSETATELASKTDTSEYGVPTVGSPPKYSWLGASELPTEELLAGVVSMGIRSYVPQLGRYLQPDPIPGGSANAYVYTFGDPVNTSDPSGESGMPGWLLEADNNEARELTEAATARRIEEEERKAAEEAAARAAAEAAAQAAAAAAAAAGPQDEAIQGPLGGYAGWACQYAAETHQEAAGCGGGSGGTSGLLTYKAIGSSTEDEFCATDSRHWLYEQAGKHNKEAEAQLKTCKEFEEREEGYPSKMAHITFGEGAVGIRSGP